ncbi:ThuA domain-containing protein [Halioglobus maricola]|uniref:ThuA domain-containing protein n=1 Tax=Halioglobus maricola TaxID=2601894 RepID=UPI0014793B0B|nr:ThuA domain-containing protein [Halioglobus maricola]
MLKRILLGVLVVFIGGAAFSYYQLRSLGLIPRADYETQAPEVPAFTRPAILVHSKTNGFIHKEAIPAGKAMLQRIADENGWELYFTDNAAIHNTQDLNKFQAVVWNNVSGDVLTTEQRAALKTWIENGGGWVGLHASGGDPSYQWQWYVDELIGAQFVGHTMAPQFQDAHVLVAESMPGITAHLETPWVVPAEEWYAFASNPRDKGYEILLTLDESSYITKGETFFGQDRMEGEHPITWRHLQGEGRVFYTAIGHQAATYSIPGFQRMVSGALSWVGMPTAP